MVNHPSQPGMKQIRAFTLIELLVVLSIIAVLLSLSVPRYFQSVDYSKEAILIENLRTVRETIDKFYGDAGRYPESLDELVDKRYLRSLPMDPVVGNATDWIVIPPPAGDKGKVYNLHSSASGVTRDGLAFSNL
jgi:general secretion pathway protein G